jgi:hypothetical protein
MMRDKEREEEKCMVKERKEGRRMVKEREEGRTMVKEMKEGRRMRTIVLGREEMKRWLQR